MTLKDRKTDNRERDNPTHPLPPSNLQVLWAYLPDTPALDIRWDEPSLHDENAGFDLLGVNVYRSFDSEFGPYHRLNDEPIGTTFWRDKTEKQFVENEDVSRQFESRGDDESGVWVFTVDDPPIVDPDTNGQASQNPNDVTVEVDGEAIRPVHVNGKAGEVHLPASKVYDVGINDTDPVHTITPDSTITCSYWKRTNFITMENNQRIFYRVTSVGYSNWDGSLVETPMEWTEAKSVDEMEKVGYPWKEAIRRNKWILEQAGERVKVFIRKHVGKECPCVGRRHHKRAIGDCETCFGQGIVGGFEGPYDILIAPRDSERSVNREEEGTKEEQTDSVWTGPEPMLSQRDFIVKQNGDRFSIGPVQMPTNRGTVLQQHFDIGLMQRNDIRMEVPVTGISDLTFPETRTKDPDEDPTEQRNPQITDKEDLADGVEERGRTVTYENIHS